MNACCSWSGGKDSCYALMQAIEFGYTPDVLLNVLNEEGKISRSHGIPKNILQAQADAAGFHLYTVTSSWTDYENNFVHALELLKSKYQLTNVIFGDIDLQEHRDWEEKVCRQAGLTAVLPLWQQDREALVHEMLNNNIKAIIVSCNDVMGKKFLGRKISVELIAELSMLGIDPCGENGEYHTLVVNCPLFNKEIQIEVGNSLQHDNYWFTELFHKV